MPLSDRAVNQTSKLLLHLQCTRSPEKFTEFARFGARESMKRKPNLAGLTGRSCLGHANFYIAQWYN